MAGEENNPQGELFFFLKPMIEESHSCGGWYQYQQIVIRSIIEEFGFDRGAIVQIPPCTGIWSVAVGLALCSFCHCWRWPLALTLAESP